MLELKKIIKFILIGGRVLNVTASSKNLFEKEKMSLSSIKKINWTDGFYRKDIGWKSINKKNYENNIGKIKNCLLFNNQRKKQQDP